MSVKDSSGNEIINVFRRVDHGAVISYHKIDYTMARHDGRYEQTFAATNTIRVFKDETTGELSKDFKSLKCHKSRNLFDENFTLVNKTVNGQTGDVFSSTTRVTTNEKILLNVGKYTINAIGSDVVAIALYSTDNTFLYLMPGTPIVAGGMHVNSLPYTFSITNVPILMRFVFAKSDNGNILPSDISNIMLNTGTSSLPYEPYGELYSADLKDYTIYGDTVNGESVGDRTGNLFDISTVTKDYYINAEGIETSTESIDTYARLSHSDFIAVPSGNYITLQYTGDVVQANAAATLSFCWYNTNKSFINRTEFILNHIWNNTHRQYTMSAIVPEGISYCIVNIAGYNNTNRHYMLNTGTSSLPYEPYGYKMPVTVEGKNLLQNTATSQTINGVTFTVNSDGSVTCNGTASGGTAPFIMSDITLPTGHYIVNGCPAGGDESTTYKILIYINNVWRVNDKGTGGSFILTEAAEVSFRIAIYSGYTCDNLTFYPMIRKADIEDDIYEPYQSPVTTNIYIPEPLKSIYNGDSPYYTDYINYKKQILHKEGINKFASDWEVGTISTSTGENESSGSYYRTKDYIPYDYRNWYTFARAVTGTVMVFGYDENKNYVGYDTDIDVEIYSSTKFQNDFAPYGVAYLKFVQAYPGQPPENWHYMLLEGYFDSESSLPPYEPCIDGDTPVTLPTLPTLYKTNIISVESTVAPSRADFTGHIKTISGGS